MSTLFISISRGFSIHFEPLVACNQVGQTVAAKLDLHHSDNFITNRKYILRADGTQYHSQIHATRGVPQGSHCGSLLYLVMSMDITDCITELNNTNLSPYADDTKLSAVVNNKQQMEQMQNAIDNLTDWSTRNRIAINALKTYHVTYKRTNKHMFQSYYYMVENRIRTVDNIKDLGVTFE